jgi:hypothetical protein
VRIQNKTWQECNDKSKKSKWVVSVVQTRQQIQERLKVPETNLPGSILKKFLRWSVALTVLFVAPEAGLPLQTRRTSIPRQSREIVAFVPMPVGNDNPAGERYRESGLWSKGQSPVLMANTCEIVKVRLQAKQQQGRSQPPVALACLLSTGVYLRQTAIPRATANRQNAVSALARRGTSMGNDKREEDSRYDVESKIGNHHHRGAKSEGR